MNHPVLCSLARLLNVSRNKYRVFDSIKGEVAWMLVKLNKINIISKSFSGGQRLMSCRARPKIPENTAWLKISIFSIPPVIQSYGHESRLTIPQKNWHASLDRWLKGFGHTVTYSQDIGCPNHNTNFGTPCSYILGGTQFNELKFQQYHWFFGTLIELRFI